MNDEIPEPIRDDAPLPDQFDQGDTVDETVYMPNHGRLMAVDYDGDRYCLECANPEYVELCDHDPYAIPYGGPVPLGSECDEPGLGCGHCLRMIEGYTLLTYDQHGRLE